MNLLESLKRCTTVVADTADLEAVAFHQPQDATTNPSLLYQAAQKPRYTYMVDEAVRYAADKAEGREARTELFMDKLLVDFGCEILKVIPGRVSTEVDARLSFDTDGTLARARRLMTLYAKAGIGAERVLIKIAATWEGIRAAEQLEREGIQCNLTLLFSFAQAAACAQAGVTLISPFVGRIHDWHKRQQGTDIAPDDDPGVAFVTRVYNYYKALGCQTQIMGASFRSVDQIVRLAGCDLLTISPALLDELRDAPGEVAPRLSVETAKTTTPEKLHLDEKTFRWMHNEDAMATEKLSEGIRNFHADACKLEQHVRRRWYRE